MWEAIFESEKDYLIQRNVCPHEEVEIVTLKEPCVQAYTKYVRSRKPGCNGKFQSCAVRQPKTIYFHTYKKVNRTRRHTVAECCPGWVHRPGEAGCQRGDIWGLRKRGKGRIKHDYVNRRTKEGLIC
ncbi:hypothetical protein CAEBREN_09339 [Caenorhabditis brenneri]|uniref:EMI domain-containing protein n=1 Tax=Caenorhabditis brenneri TaxID=135651 RepID=G0N5U7_CAEBE|nr:hypothetical protein CAEBREN_09339 [Caenorhabditis brenneri]